MIKGNVRALRNHVLVEEMEAGERITKGGIIIMSNDDSSKDIRPRWCKVYDVGEGIDDIKPNDYILVAHGQWTRRVEVETDSGKKFIQRVKYPDGVLLVSEEKMTN